MGGGGAVTGESGWISTGTRVLKDEEAKLFRACLADVWFEIEMCDDIEE